MIALSIAAIAISMGLWWSLDIYFLRTLALMSGLHFMFFDYLINIILYRNKVIERPGAEKWLTYMGDTSKIDRWSFWRDMNPWMRLYLKFVVLNASLIIFLYL